RRFHRLAVVVEVGPALVGDGVEPLVGLGGRGHEVGFLEVGQGGVDDAGARRIEAAGPLLQRLDEVVAVARLLLDQIERDEAQIARGEHAADAEIVAEAAPVAPAAAAAAPATPTAPPRGLHLLPGAVHVPLPVIVMWKRHDVSPIYLTRERRYDEAGRSSRYIAKIYLACHYRIAAIYRSALRCTAALASRSSTRSHQPE